MWPPGPAVTLEGDAEPGVWGGTSNAYMLVYVREESVTEVLKTVTDEDIPPHLKTRFDFEEEEEEKKRKQRQVLWP